MQAKGINQQFLHEYTKLPADISQQGKVKRYLHTAQFHFNNFMVHALLQVYLSSQTRLTSAHQLPY